MKENIRQKDYAGTAANAFISALRTLFTDRSGSDDMVAERNIRVMHWFLITAALAIPFFGFLPELFYLTPDLNDSAFHLGVVRNTIDAVRHGLNPLDFWVPTWLNGFPLFHYYQPGPYLLVSLLHFLTAGKVQLLMLYRLTMLVALVAFPIANYRALRWLNLSTTTAAWGAFFSFLISAQGKYGIELESFTWSGWGLFTQLVALPILPLALAGGFRAITGSRKTIGYAALLAAAFLAHILYGYIAALSMIIVPFMTGPFAEVRKKLIVLLRYLLQAFCIISFFAVPLMLHRAYHLKSLYDEASKFDSHGARQILTWLFSGDLFDSGRLPVLTCLVTAGLYLCGRKWLEKKSPEYGWIACGFIFWLCLYFGRATWGSLIDLLPMSHGLHLERLSSGVHIFGIWLAAIAMGRLSVWALGFHKPFLKWSAGMLLLILILPAMIERTQYLVRNANNVRHDLELYKKELPELAPIIKKLKEDPEARVYAGHSGNWGHTYKIGSVEIYQILSAEAISTVTHAPFSWALTTDVGFQFSSTERESYNLYNVRYLLTKEHDAMPPGSQLVLQSGRHSLYRIPMTGPFSIVSVPVTVIGDKDTTAYLLLEWAKGLWSRKQSHIRLVYEGKPTGEGKVLTMEDLLHFSYEGPAGKITQNVFDPPGIFMTDPPPPPSGSIAEVSSSRQEAKSTIYLDEPGVVIFKETYHPNWRAELDGKSAQTMLLSPGFIGVPVPAGNHRLRMTYESGWWKMVLLLLGPAAAFGIEMISPSRYVRRKKLGAKK
jgi:hypothetical protein